jgi:hypothetical protein
MSQPQISTIDVGSAVADIKRWGTSKWAVAVQPLLPNEIPSYRKAAVAIILGVTVRHPGHRRRR